MGLSAILLIIAVFIIIAQFILLIRKERTKLFSTSEETKNQSPRKKSKHCPSCGKQISSDAHKCPECKMYISLCPTCDTDSVFNIVDKKGKKHLKVQSGFSALGWPLTKIATCNSCNTAFLLCNYCGNPVPTVSQICSHCSSELSVGISSLVKDLAEVLGPVIAAIVKVKGKILK